MSKPIPFERSFASHYRSKFWSSTNNISPLNVTLHADKKYYFECDKCKHTFFSRISDITGHNSWCNYCSLTNLCNNICDICFKKSFASHPASSLWSPKNPLSSREVFLNCNKKYLFVCSKCEHEYSVSPNTIVQMKCGCPYCAKIRLCECEKCYAKSFALSPRAKFWSEKNELKPHQVFFGSELKFFFNCENNHEFKSNPSDILFHNSAPEKLAKPIFQGA